MTSLVLAMPIVIGVISVGCRSSDVAPVTPPITPPSPFVHTWEPIPKCRIRVTSPALDRFTWESCPGVAAGCRRVRFADKQQPYGPGLGSWFPVAGFGPAGLVAGFSFPRAPEGVTTRHLVIRADGAVPVALDLLADSACSLFWLRAGDGWALAAATAPDPASSHTLSVPLDVRAATDLRAAAFGEADWPLMTHAAGRGEAAFENGVPHATCSLERKRGDPGSVRIAQRDGRALPLAMPAGVSPYVMAYDCDQAIAHVTEPNVGPACFDMPGCGSHVAQLVITHVVR